MRGQQWQSCLAKLTERESYAAGQTHSRGAPAGGSAIAVAPPQERGRGAVEAHERAQGYQLRQGFQIHD